MANKNNQNKKDNLAFIIGGLFILGLVFATYNYFNKTPETTEKEENKSTIEKLKDIISAEGNEESTNTKENEEEVAGSVSSPAAQTSTIEWVATNYEEGDIQGDSYTVKSGDTLWEIAEAVYGNGNEWTKILDANADSIGYLPNGQQALIIPGQTIALP